MNLAKIMLEEVQIAVLVTKNFATISYVKGYHAKGRHPYQTRWMPVIEEYLLSERTQENPIDKYAVQVKKEK